MKPFRSFQHTGLFLLLLLIGNLTSFAGVEPYQNQLRGKIKKGDSLIVKDEKFRNPLFDWDEITNKKVKNYISLEMIYDSAGAFTRPFSCELKLKVEYFSQPDQAEPVTINEVKLKVSYDTVTGLAYKGKDVFDFANGYYVKVSVTDIVSQEFGDELPPIFQLVSRIVIERKYRPHPEMRVQFNGTMEQGSGTGNNDGPLQLQMVSPDPTSNLDQYLKLTWVDVYGAEEYDLEWAVFDKGTEKEALLQRILADDMSVTLSELNSLFENNSTRVTKESNTHDITMVYDADYILVRMRQVEYNDDGIRIEYAWDYKRESETKWAIWEINRHETNLNWQYSATFAEEGKRKEVVSYFDGTARSRQAVTMNNEDRVAVVQETIYDEFGRQAASIMPATTLSEVFKYYKNFNVAKLSTDPVNIPYDYRHLRGNGTTPGSCEPLPQPLEEVSGASKYYSPSNEFANSTDPKYANNYFHKYVPQAFGYPISVTKYVPDNTGRIRTQGGVGQEFQPNGTHATRYFYGKPDSWELDRIFGNDVGYADHYQKNMVVDANGGVSISYLNASGKTIATALAGEKPAMLDGLPGTPAAQEETFPILRPSQFVFEASSLSLKATATYLSPLTAPVTLGFNMQKLIAQYKNQGNTFQICSNCYYDYTVKVTDNCGELITTLNGSGPIGSQTSDCNNVGVEEKSISLGTLPIGEYKISIEFKLSEDVIEEYTKNYILTREANNDLKTEYEFILDYLYGADLSSCFSDCRTCEIALGTQADFTDAIIKELENYKPIATDKLPALQAWIGGLHTTLRNQCLASKPSCMGSPCERFEKPMMDDVSPGGQYSLFQLTPFLALEQSVNVIYNKWRLVFPVYAESHPNYADDSFLDEENNRLYPHKADFTLEKLVQYWKPEWAEKFLQYHPEFCKLDFCRSYSSYISWDDQVNTFYTKASDIPNIPGTTNLQYLHANAAWLLAQDKFFQPNNPGASQKTNFENDLLQYSNRIMKVTGGTIKSLTQVIDYQLYCADLDGNTNSSTLSDNWTNCTPVANCRIPDREWALYRDMYFQLKEKYYGIVRNAGACAGKCTVGTPVNLLAGCASVSDFTISRYVSPTEPDPAPCSNGGQKIRIAYVKGAVKQTITVNIYAPAELPAISGLSPQTFAAGQSEKIICIPAGIDISLLRIKSATCSGTTPAPVCNGVSGQMTLLAGGRQTGSNKFEEINTTTQIRNIYSIVPGYANQTPADAPYCTGGTVASKQFYNCYKVFLPGASSPVQFENVWVIKCSQDLCASAPVYNMTYQVSAYKFAANGKEYYVVLQGGGGSGLPPCSSTLPSTYYPCLKVFVGSNPTPIVFVNANIVECTVCPNVINATTALGDNAYAISDGTIYHLFPNTSSSYVPATIHCSNPETAWESCVTVNVNGTSQTFNNVSIAYCLPNPCENAPTVNADWGEDLGGGFHYVQYGGSATVDLFVIPGSPGTPPSPASYCSSGSVHWFDCISFAGDVPQASYESVWVVICYTYNNLAANGGESDPGAGFDTVKVPVPFAASKLEFVDFADNSIYRIQYSTSSEKQAWKNRHTLNTSMTAPAKLKDFSAFTYRKFFSIRISDSVFVNKRDVWVAKKEFKPMAVPTALKSGAPAMSVTSLSTCSGLHSFTMMELGPEYECSEPMPGFKWRIFNSNSCPGGQPPASSGVAYFESLNGTILYSTGFSFAAGQGEIDICVPQNASQQASWYGTWYACGTVGSCPVTPNCPEYLANKEPRFPEPSYEYNPQATDVTNEINDKAGLIAEQIKTNCEAQADKWMEQLAACLASYPNKVQEIRTKLIEVCMKGGDVERPFGASTTKPGEVTASGLSSFKQVITSVLGLTSLTMDCNPWVLESPAPYLPKQQKILPVTMKSNAEICSKLQALQTEYTTANPGKTFHEYLKDRFGEAMNLTAVQLTQLQKSCNNCHFILEEDMMMPVFLDPGATGCISKAEYETAKIAFFAEVGEVVPEDPRYEEVFTNFMNHRFGFAMAYFRYAEFEANSDPAAVLCNKLPYAPIDVDPYACLKTMVASAVINGRRDYEIFIAEVKRQFRLNYVDVCSKARTNASLTTQQQIYHYTLYYYDQAGNLVRTVSPEGVRLLDPSEFEKIEKARDYARGNCSYSGPVANSDKNTALLYLSNVLAANQNRSIEMWLKRNDDDISQVMAVTPDKKFLFNACLNVSSKLLSVEVHTTTQTNPDNLEFTLSNHKTVNLSAITDFPEWMHVVLRGNTLASGTVEVFVNGQLMPVVVNDPPAGCGWEVGPGNPIALPENLTTLKHLRVYNRLLLDNEIAANAAEGCLSLAPQYFTALNSSMIYWSRFNTPAEGSAGNADPYSTVETQYVPVYPEHKLLSSYVFNSTGQVVRQSSPDGGTTDFWYDHLSRLVISQNAEQRGEFGNGNSRFSYTLYEPTLGRIMEVGEKSGLFVSPIENPGYVTEDQFGLLLGSGVSRQITQTIYDKVPVPGNGIPSALGQNNLRKRVSTSLTRESVSGPVLQASFYDYDLMGNVKTLWQQVDGLGIKKLEYDYDLASGKVNMVSYQKDANDQFFYKYIYDAENKITEAWTGTELDFPGHISNAKKDAHYRYYLHGPLARTELGGDVQGLDYAYTLQGWVKGMNSQKLDNSSASVVDNRDIGRDGAPGEYVTFNRDEVAYSLFYHAGDYKSVGGSGSAAFEVGMTNAIGTGTGNALFNGNIPRMTVAIRKFGSTDLKGYSYRYDQLNRLKTMQADNLSGVIGNSWSVGTDNSYKEEISYDANGNIKRYTRNGANTSNMPLEMDDLTYVYKANSNQLIQVLDAVDATNYSETRNQTVDLDGVSNYQYDKIGNLIHDDNEGLTIEWTVYGKISKIIKADGTVIVYNYDAGGKRIRKSYNKSGQTTDTWYTSDAHGNTISVYTNRSNNLTGKYWLEQNLFGSSRLGTWNPVIDINNASGTNEWESVGKKSYELSNHLGNVLAVVSDKNVGNGIAEVQSASDYYPFGMLMPGRKFNGAGYRYGFNGKENDNEVKEGDGLQQDYGMRIYDCRLGRFLSVDPLSQEYPELTPYQFASNRPIDGIDQDGLEFEPYWASRVQVKIGEYEGNLRRTDPENAEKRIRAEKLKAAAVMATPLVIFDLATGGNVTRTAGTAFTVWGASEVYEHTNRNSHQKNPQIRKENAQNAQNAAWDMILTYGTNTIISNVGKGLVLTGEKAIKTLTKFERIKIFVNKLASAKAVTSQDEARKLINSTLDEVEDMYSGIPKAKGATAGDDGRMYGILDERYVTELSDGTKVGLTKGHRIIFRKDGGFDIQTRDGTQTLFTKKGGKKDD